MSRKSIKNLIKNLSPVIIEYSLFQNQISNKFYVSKFKPKSRNS